jgi:hypothetical protein
MMQFDPPQASDMLGPLLAEQALSDIPIFGDESADIEATIESFLRHSVSSKVSVEAINEVKAKLPESFYKENTVAGKLRALRMFVREQQLVPEDANLTAQLGALKVLSSGADEILLASDGTGSCREIHEALLNTLTKASGVPREAQAVIDHSMLLRAKEKYLFDADTNRNIARDDPWIMFVWDWIAGLSTYLPLSRIVPMLTQLAQMRSMLPRMGGWNCPTWISVILEYMPYGQTTLVGF